MLGHRLPRQDIFKHACARVRWTLHFWEGALATLCSCLSVGFGGNDTYPASSDTIRSLTTKGCERLYYLEHLPQQKRQQKTKVLRHHHAFHSSLVYREHSSGGPRGQQDTVLRAGSSHASTTEIAENFVRR
ncbi:hypothetical protein WG66_008328 [Moniliophthora roreri]|nr:hypothetical protein WG66_008328 [Moniliophthora roreri]